MLPGAIVPLQHDFAWDVGRVNVNGGKQDIARIHRECLCGAREIMFVQAGRHAGLLRQSARIGGRVAGNPIPRVAAVSANLRSGRKRSPPPKQRYCCLLRQRVLAGASCAQCQQAQADNKRFLHSAANVANAEQWIEISGGRIILSDSRNAVCRNVAYIPNPGIAVIPIAGAANGFRQAEGRRGHD
jgi:hypothetical protein